MAPATKIASSSYWIESGSLPTFRKLEQNITVDVAVVGGGMTGLTAAYLLAAAGKSVAVLERGRCAQAETGHTSAHLTMVTDTRLPDLVSRVGHTHAQAVWDAGLAALAQVDSVVREHAIDCGFEWVDGFLHAPAERTGSESADAEAQQLAEEARLTSDLGFDAEFVASVPGVGTPGIRFAGQARFRPRQYLAGLARALTGMGVRIYEHSEAREFHEKPLTITANGHTVTCGDVFLATHNPLVGVRSEEHT